MLSSNLTHMQFEAGAQSEEGGPFVMMDNESKCLVSSYLSLEPGWLKDFASHGQKCSLFQILLRSPPLPPLLPSLHGRCYLNI